MDVTAALQARCDPDELFAYVDDLGRYPAWMDLVHAADRLDGEPPVWDAELRARLGPLARSKRLRMVRTVHDSQRRVVRFERQELDGRSHSPWILSAEVGARGDLADLAVHLHYGGGLWTGGVLERALTEQINQGRDRLIALVTPTQ